MQTLTWRLVNDEDVASNIIRFVERGVVSHVEFLSTDGTTAIGARASGGVRARPIDYKKFTLDLRYRALCSDEEYAAAWNFLNAQMGKPYDFKEILGIGFDRDWRQPESWICSELWAAVMEQGNLIGRLASPIGLVLPQDCLFISSAMFKHHPRYR